LLKYLAGGSLGLLAIVAIFTCSPDDRTEACPTPVPDSPGAVRMQEARGLARFQVAYPCFLPNGQRLETTSVTGPSGRQQVELAFDGPFEMRFRQSQFPPAVSADPAGASRVVVELFDNTPATLIERYDGSSKALYHLLWERNGFFWELQASGPPQQRRAILESARSLQ
jgi:hypothetical protein